MIRTLALTIALAAPIAAGAQMTYITPTGPAPGYTVHQGFGGTLHINPTGPQPGYIANTIPTVPQYQAPQPDYLEFSRQITNQWNWVGQPR